MTNLVVSQEVNGEPVDKPGVFAIPETPGDDVTISTTFDRPVNLRSVNVALGGSVTTDTFTITVTYTDGGSATSPSGVS